MSQYHPHPNYGQPRSSTSPSAQELYDSRQGNVNLVPHPPYNGQPPHTNQRYPDASPQARYYPLNTSAVMPGGGVPSHMLPVPGDPRVPTHAPNLYSHSPENQLTDNRTNMYNNHIIAIHPADAIQPTHRSHRSEPNSSQQPPYGNYHYSSHVSSPSQSSSHSTPASPTQPMTNERYRCDECGKTFSRSHDRKRHHETQHMVPTTTHKCRYCHKEFSRADSLKRHLDNGCEERPMP